MESMDPKAAPLYTPLSRESSQIRLFRFIDAENSKLGFRLELNTVSLDTNPDYSALSYEWGDPNDAGEIEVNGSPLTVTRNLIAALSRIGSTRRLMWVDAICINQADVTEKNYQVLMMARIYKQAEGVVSWLGDSDDSSRRGMRFISDLASS